MRHWSFLSLQPLLLLLLFAVHSFPLFPLHLTIAIHIHVHVHLRIHVGVHFLCIVGRGVRAVYLTHVPVERGALTESACAHVAAVRAEFVMDRGDMLRQVQFEMEAKATRGARVRA